jgi:hypothetical protein
MRTLSIWTLMALTTAPASAGCDTTGCTAHDAFVDWSAPADAAAPAIDRRPHAHLAVATFALG